MSRYIFVGNSGQSAKFCAVGTAGGFAGDVLHSMAGRYRAVPNVPLGAMRLSKRDALYDLIQSRLISTRYRFGDRILVKEITAETGASRQPVGSALNALALDGFVRVIPQVGCEVIKPRMSDMEDFFQFFGLVEGEVSGLAAARRSGALLKDLAAINGELRNKDLDGPLEEVLRLQHAFHSVVHKMAAAPLATARFRNLAALASFLVMQSSDAAPRNDIAFAGLANVYDAIERGDSGQALKAMQTHAAMLKSLCTGSKAWC